MDIQGFTLIAHDVALAFFGAVVLMACTFGGSR